MRRVPASTATIGALLAATLLAACGGSGSAGGDTTTTAGATTGTTSSAAAFPVSIDHAFGTTTVSKQPERVVVIGYTEVDTVVALGVTPVSYPEFITELPDALGPWTSSKITGTKPTILKGELNVEQVLGMNPDLVIGVNQALTQETYATLSARVPTLARPKEYADYTVPNEVMVELVGKALGKPAEAAKLLADSEALVAKYKSENPQWSGKTANVVWPRAEGKGWYSYTSKDTSQATMAALGFSLPPKVAAMDQSTFYVEVAKESTADIDADVLLVVDPEKQQAVTEADPLYQNLSAVKAGRVYWMPADVYAAFRFVSVLSVPYALEKMVPELQRMFPKS